MDLRVPTGVGLAGDGVGEMFGVGWVRFGPPIGRREKLRGLGVGVGGGGATVGCDTTPRGAPCAAIVDWGFVAVATPVTRGGEMLRGIGVGVAGATADGEGATRRSVSGRGRTAALKQAL